MGSNPQEITPDWRHAVLKTEQVPADLTGLADLMEIVNNLRKPSRGSILAETLPEKESNLRGAYEQARPTTARLILLCRAKGLSQTETIEMLGSEPFNINSQSLAGMVGMESGDLEQMA